MTPVKPDKRPASACGPPHTERDIRNLEKARAIFASLPKYIHAKTIYAANNPNVSKFASVFHHAFRAFFEGETELVLAIEQYRITWHGETVYENDRKTESIAFLLYKDGVGEIAFHSTVTQAELERFIDLIKGELYNPSAHLDVVSKLWQSEFTDISYRVFDEYADGAAGAGRGSGSESREQPLLVNDHPGLPAADGHAASNTGTADQSIEPLASYLYGVVDRMQPKRGAVERDQQLQEIVCSLFAVSAEERQRWRDEVSRANEENKLLWLLNTMLDFTKVHSSAPVARDILDIIERLVRYSVEEAHVPTLVALLEIQEQMALSGSIAPEYQSLPGRIRDELTNAAFLLSLGKTADGTRNDVHDVLRYFRLIGRQSVPGLCELLANSKDPSAHKEACDALVAIAGDDIPVVVNVLNLDNPFEAKDVVCLLRHVATDEVPTVIKKLMSSTDPQVREQVIEYLAYLGNEEAASLLTPFLEEGDASVRVKTLAAVEQFKHPAIVQKVTSMCFAEDTSVKNPDELERMFRTVGKLGGEAVLPQLRQMIKKKGWLGLSKGQGRQNKLLVITALRHIPGAASADMLKELAEDGENLVRTKAFHVLKQLDGTRIDMDRERTPAGAKEPE